MNKRLHLFLLISIIGIFVCSAINPQDYQTWALEVSPSILLIGVLIKIYPTFKFSNLVYVLIWIHGIIVIIGAHYTYSKVPVFNWLKDILDLSRNHYDRFAHFVIGAIMAIFLREILIRKSPIKKGKWLFGIVVSISVALSSIYEILEFIIMKMSGKGVNAFLGTQGDQWDAQWDMLLALIGTIISLVILRNYHDQSMKNIENQIKKL
ncbi:DUF2238 domain-containing protein [Lutibacter sp. B2]|nr:DUF2238 domain-containing protein [Lutibacter sp. B2]